jgi:hypothetical protein
MRPQDRQERARKRRRDGTLNPQQASSSQQSVATAPSELAGNGELPPAGKKGAAAALERLELQEEKSHRRLQAAMARGNPVEIAAAQDFWLKCSETLRRLDLAVETARREAETQIPLKVAESAITAAAEWMKLSFMVFLSSEGTALQGIRDFGEWKAYAIERFKGILTLTVKNADKTCSAIPAWSKERIAQAWHMESVPE